MPISIFQNPIFATLYVAGAVLVGFFGRRRVFGFWGFFLLSMFVTPIIVGLVLILAAPDPDVREKERQQWLKLNGMR